ncbi:hypothetical protein EYF80_031457 [Liparis tanakae]|uniref:Uncharacterized protein n=1 Tax=Liparis tanakae TaxID=230148 RepID=A0A4Z2GZ15_9TELE|nr:hypothetical protein EYF80_031457 [Liparis tanakae]
MATSHTSSYGAEGRCSSAEDMTTITTGPSLKSIFTHKTKPDLLSSNRMPPSIPRITGSPVPPATRPLQVTSAPVHSQTVAWTVLSCSWPWWSATLSTTVYSPLSSSMPRFRRMPVSETREEHSLDGTMYILEPFILAVQLVFDMPCNETLYGAAKPGPSLSVTDSS